MKELKKIFCRYDMVCDTPGGVGMEIYRMPDFFGKVSGMESGSMHMHDFYEIIWFQDGGGVHHVDFGEYPVVPGSIFIISPGQVHSFDSRRDRRGVLIKVCTGIFDEYVNIPCATVCEGDFPSLMRLVEAMEEELRNTGSIGNKESLQALLSLFMIRVRRSIAVTDAAALNPVKASHRTFLTFRRLIEENYRRMHTVKEYAALLNVTPKTLTLYVNECSNHSPLELINSRIILEAKRLLRYSMLSVKEIAFRLGFDDPSYFVKFFKRIVRSSPADFRESF